MRSSIHRILSTKWAWVSLSLLVLVIVVTSHLRSRVRAIQFQPLKIGDLTTAIYGSAQLKTDRSFDLKLGTTARIAKILKSVGQRVKRGEVVVVFDNLPPFRAPMDGTLTAVTFRTGETAFVQSTVLSIVEPKDFYLEMSLDQKSVRHVKRGQDVRISFEGYRDMRFEGKVRATFSNNGVFYAVIDLNDGDPSFLPGMSADVAIVTETKKGVLLAPLGAVKDGKLLLKRQGPPEEVSVSVGGNDGGVVEVGASNIREGDLAVIRSSVPFRPGGGPK